jgi:transposase
MSTRSQRPRGRSSQGAARPFDGLRTITPQAAGVDIGSPAIMAGVPHGDAPQSVRAFGPSTAELEAWADWFVDRGIRTGTRASPGGYWMPRFETLAARGLPCCLSSAPAIQPVPGRTSDVLDGQGLHTWQSAGLFTASWRPDADLVALRPL